MSEQLGVPMSHPHGRMGRDEKSAAALLANPWVYNNTSRSIIAVILWHGLVNFTGELFDMSARANAVSIGLWVIGAVGITLIWGPQRFSPVGLRKPSSHCGGLDD